MNIVTKEEIQKELNKLVGKENALYLYEITSNNFGAFELNFEGRPRPIYVRLHEVGGETKVSYIIGYKKNKVNKETLRYTDKYTGCQYRTYATIKDLENAIWIRLNAREIATEVQNCGDFDKLSQVLEVIR